MSTTSVLAAFGTTFFAFEGKVDVGYLIDIPNADIAQRALDFLSDQVNEIELHKRNGAGDVKRAWRGVLRACLAYGVPLTPENALYAKSLGIGLPQ